MTLLVTLNTLYPIVFLPYQRRCDVTKQKPVRLASDARRTCTRSYRPCEEEPTQCQQYAGGLLEDTFGEALLGRATALDSLCSFVISRMIQSQQFTISGDVQEHIARCLKSIREDCAQGKLPIPYGQEYEKALSFYKSWLDRPTEEAGIANV